MMEKDFSYVKLPCIRPTLSRTQSVIASSDGKRLRGNIDFDFQNGKHNAKAPVHDKTMHWKSANYSDEKATYESLERRRKALETSSKTNESSDFTRQDGAKFVLPLRRHNSEPFNFLQQSANPFTVKATSLKLNHRAKEKTGNNNEKKHLFTDLLPSIFFDTRLVNDNSKVQLESTSNSKKTPRQITVKNKTLTKESNGKVSKTVEVNERVRNNAKVKTSDIDQHADKAVRKPVKVLPKRRLSEQIDSYEINRNNHHVYPRRITIKTSKSCPTIVIHECGEADETADDSITLRDDNASDSKEIASVQMNGCKTLNKDTTSFVPCWKPKQSIVNEK